MIKVGVDARHLSGNSNGIQTHLVNLLNCAIIKTRYTHQWFLYSPYRMDKKSFFHSNVKVISTPFSNKFLGFSVIYLQFVIPVLSLIDNIDIFWFPANRSSLFLSKHIAQVLTIHDLVWQKFPETMTYPGLKLDEFFMVRSARCADIVTTVSQSSSTDIVKAGVTNSNKIFVIVNGVNSPDEVEKLHGAPFFLFVGTLEPRKNLKRLLQAYASLPLMIKEKSKLVIVGSKGWGRVNLSDLISQFELKNRVDVMGHVDEAVLGTLYANAEFLVMPSLYEGFGLPLIEAMSYGTPVLTSDNSSMPEVAGKAGVFVDAFDVQSIADGLQEMITNDRLRARLAENTERNVARFRWGASANRLIFIFEKAISLKKDKLR